MSLHHTNNHVIYNSVTNSYRCKILIGCDIIENMVENCDHIRYIDIYMETEGETLPE